MNASEFKKAARTRNCTGNDRYLCAPDRNLSSLIEFCTDTKRSLFEKGNFLLVLKSYLEFLFFDNLFL